MVWYTCSVAPRHAGSSQTRDQLHVSCMAGGFLMTEPPGKPPCAFLASLVVLGGKESTFDVGDPSSISGLGRSTREGNGNPLQYSCLENSWTEETGRLQTMGLQKVRQNWVTNTFFLLYLEFFHFNYKLSLCGPLYIYLFEDLCGPESLFSSWGQRSFKLLFLQINFLPFSLFFLLEPL